MKRPATAPRLSLRAAIEDRRNRLIASPRFRRLAARFFLTRPVARRQARRLFDLSAGFVYTQTLRAFVELRLAEMLSDEAKTTTEIAERCRLTPDRTELLMRAAAALDLAAPRGPERWALGQLGAALVGNDGVAAMVTHHPMLYRDLEDPVALLRGDRGTELSRYWTYASGREGAGDASIYSSLMARSQAMVAEQILDALPLANATWLMDVGGGTGVFLDAVARRHPHLRLTLFDLPDVSPSRAPAGPATNSSVERVTGDFFKDLLPRGADIITLVRVLHDHDDRQAMTLLRNVRAALAPGGRIVIAEPMAQTPGAEPAGDTYFGFYLLAMGQGRPRPGAEIAEMLRVAGFSGVREYGTDLPLIVRVLTATA